MTTEVVTLVDSNVLLDVARGDPVWAGWPEDAFERTADEGPLLINPIIYAEVSASCQNVEEVDAALDDATVRPPVLAATYGDEHANTPEGSCPVRSANDDSLADLRGGLSNPDPTCSTVAGYR